MKKIMAILGLATIMSAASLSSINAANNNLTKKCRIKKVSDHKMKFKGKRCDRLVNGKLYNDSYYYYY
jgi:hypothetical protein